MAFYSWWLNRAGSSVGDEACPCCSEATRMKHSTHFSCTLAALHNAYACNASGTARRHTAGVDRQRARMPGNKKKNKGANKAKNAPARSNAANKDDLAGLDEILR